ncbi:MAG: response regulator [Ignavibacteria bacterium]|nr:response regulator [Ignavibacteria bacterium]
MRLLIVEDNSEIREMIRSLFESKFNLIRVCEDGDTALSEYESFRPDWIFMDIEMKKVDGITASKEILKLYPEAKIIIITNHKSASIKRELISAGVQKYVLKENMHSLLDMFDY